MTDDDLLDDYIAAHIDAEPSALHSLWRRTHLRHVYPRMCSGHTQGRLLAMLAAIAQPRRVIELGTFTGYSALCLAENLPEDAEVHTVEIDDEMEPELSELFAAPHPGASVRLHIGDAMDIIPTLPAPWDMAFIDANKRSYCEYYRMVLPLVRKGGFIIADNTLWYGKMTDGSAHDAQTLGIMEFNKMVGADASVEKVILPLRDGLTIIWKRD